MTKDAGETFTRHNDYMTDQRIRGELSRSVLKGAGLAHSQNRKETLESLGAVAIDKIS